MDLAAIKAYVDPTKIQEFLQGLLAGPRGVLGIDLGSHSIKVVWIKQEGRGEKLKAWGYLPLDMDPDAAPADRIPKAGALLKDFLAKERVELKQAATSVSGNAVIVRYVRLPLLSKPELIKTLPIEAEPFIPFDIQEVNLGAHILEEVKEEGQKKIETVLVAAKREVVQDRVDILTAAGITPVIIDVDAFAIEGMHERSRFKDDQGGILYLNIGQSVTNLSIMENGVTRVVRDIFISGRNFTKAIQTAIGAERAQAEEAKKKYGILLRPEEKEKAIAEKNHEALGVSQALSSVLQDLVTEMQRSVDFYLSQGPERSITRVVLAGGTASLKNLSQFLMADLKVPVDVINPLEFLQDQGVKRIPEDQLPSLAVATGLALRKMKDWA